MALFVKQITDPEEAYKRLVQKDKKISSGAKEEFVASMDHELVEFLYEKFQEAKDVNEKVLILETYAGYRNNLSEEDLALILKLVTIKDPLIVESMKEILLGLSESNLKAATAVLASTTDPDIHKIIQYGIENSGVLGRILDQWSKFSLKDQILYIEELVTIQSPKTYPIFLEIMKEGDAESEDRNVLQVEFTKHLNKIKNPDFMDICIEKLPTIAASVRYPLFKSMQIHGHLFFEKFFDGLSRKSENIKLQSLKLIDQLVDANSYPYLFPFLLDSAKQVPQTTIEAISKIVKAFCDELEAMGEEGRNGEFVKERITYFEKPLTECLTEKYGFSVKGVVECLLRIGRYDQDVILANLPAIYKLSEGYFKNFLRGLNIKARRNLLVSACCYPQIETGKTALRILMDPTEGYMVDTLNTLISKHFPDIPKEIQVSVINMLNDPKLQSFVTDILNHSDPQFRMTILKSLGESGAPNAVALIGTKIRDPELEIREAVLNLLDNPVYKDTEALDIMLILLSDVNSDLVLKTIDRVKEYNDPKVIVALNKVVASGDKELKTAAHAAIAYITKRRFLNDFYQLNPKARAAVGTSLIRLDPTFLEETTKNLSDNDPKVRVLSAQILEVLYLHITPDLKTNLIVAVRDPDPKVRAIIVMILGKMGGVSVVDLLISCLADRDDRVRANAVEALLEVADISVAEKIVPCLYDSNNRVRGNAIMTLWKLGYYNVYNNIVEMFHSDDKWMRASVAFAIGELKDIRFFPVLISNLKDKDADVRRNVVKALSKIADPYTLAPYIRPLRFDHDENVRKEVAAALTIKSNVVPMPTR